MSPPTKIKSGLISLTLSKNELKYLFIYTNNHNGIPIHNKSNNICYFITGFNMIARLQYIIYKEIDNLVELDKIKKYVDKINKNICLNDDESKKFNKYLLIQTIIEVRSEDILKNIYKRYDSIIIQYFIELRFSEYSFSESSLNKNFDQKFIKYIEFKCEEIKKKCINKYFDNEKLLSCITQTHTNEVYIDINKLKYFSDIQNIFGDIKGDILKLAYDIDGIKSYITIEIFTSIKDKINNNLNVLLKNIGKYFCKITDKEGDLISFRLKPETEKYNISEIYAKFYQNINQTSITNLV